MPAAPSDAPFLLLQESSVEVEGRDLQIQTALKELEERSYDIRGELA
jgi:hypothetical protein